MEAAKSPIGGLVGVVLTLDRVEIPRPGEDGVEHAPVLAKRALRPEPLGLSRLHYGQLLAQFFYLSEEDRFSLALILHRVDGIALVGTSGTEEKLLVRVARAVARTVSIGGWSGFVVRKG